MSCQGGAYTIDNRWSSGFTPCRDNFHPYKASLFSFRQLLLQFYGEIIRFWASTRSFLEVFLFSSATVSHGVVGKG
jgi:hypothetical protein